MATGLLQPAQRAPVILAHRHTAVAAMAAATLARTATGIQSHRLSLTSWATITGGEPGGVAYPGWIPMTTPDIRTEVSNRSVFHSPASRASVVPE